MGFATFGKMAAGLALASVSSGAIGADNHPGNGSSWRVAAVNGEATPASTYHISFLGADVTGRLGCNDFGGKMRPTETGFRLTALRATSRVCGDVAAGFEGTAFAILTQPVALQWSGRDRLTLSGTTGNLTLERIP